MHQLMPALSVLFSHLIEKENGHRANTTRKDNPEGLHVLSLTNMCSSIATFGRYLALVLG